MRERRVLLSFLAAIAVWNLFERDHLAAGLLLGMTGWLALVLWLDERV